MVNKFKIGNRTIGDNEPPLIIAEIGINHNGSLDTAIAIAESAIKSGAEVIKHQTHIVDDEMINEAKKIVPGNSSKSIYEIISKCALNESDEKKLMNHVKKLKSIFISTPFSREAANRLKRFNIPAFKIGSGECNNYPLIKHVASFGKPIILSTGMNSIPSVKKAVEIKLGISNILELGNLDSYRDWGHSKDYVRAMHMIVNHDTPDEFIVATGETHSVRNLCETVFKKLGMDYLDYIVQNPKYMRPEELKYLKGDPSKAREILGWKTEYTFDTMLEEMIERWQKEL